MIALLSESYAEALEYSEQSLAVAVTPLDRNLSTGLKLCALVALRRTEEGAKLLEAYRRRCIADGQLVQLNGTDTIFGVCKILQGNIRDGLRLLEEAILRREKEGYRFMADWPRLHLAEIYLQMIAGNEKPPPLPILLRNLPTILRVMMTAPSRIPDLLKRVLANPHFDPAGHHIGRAQMILAYFTRPRKTCPRASASDRGKAYPFAIRANPDTCAGRYSSRGTGAIAYKTILADANPKGEIFSIPCRLRVPYETLSSPSALPA